MIRNSDNLIHLNRDHFRHNRENSDHDRDKTLPDQGKQCTKQGQFSLLQWIFNNFTR